jgi:hypothetical protein
MSYRKVGIIAAVAFVVLGVGAYSILGKNIANKSLGASVYNAISAPNQYWTVQTLAASGINVNSAILNGKNVNAPTSQEWNDADKYFRVASTLTALAQNTATRVNATNFDSASGAFNASESGLVSGQYFYEACIHDAVIARAISSGHAIASATVSADYCGLPVSFVIPQSHPIAAVIVSVSNPTSYIDNSIPACPKTGYMANVRVSTPTGGVAPYHYIPSFGGPYSTLAANFSISIPGIPPTTRPFNVTVVDSIGDRRTSSTTNITVPVTHPSPCAANVPR